VKNLFYMESKSSSYTKKEWKKFTKTHLIEVAKSCSGKGDFYVNYRDEYNFCNREGILKEILKVIPRKRKWDKESLLEEAKKYSSRKEWMMNNISSYNTGIKLGYYDLCVKHMGKPKSFSPEKKWTYGKVKAVYDKYTNLVDLRENDSAAMSAAYFNGWHKKLSKNYIKVPNRKLKWTYDKVKEEFLKYDSIKELSKNNPTVYVKALKNKWLKEIATHMTKGYKKWTIEKLVEEVSKYPKTQLYKKCPAALQYIKRHKLEKQIFKK